MSGDGTGAAEPPADTPAPEGAETVPASSLTSEPPRKRRRWLTGLLVGLLALNLAASAVAIGWIAWVVSDEPRWLDSVQGPTGEAGPTGAQGLQGETGAQGDQGSTGEAGTSADVDTLNLLTERLAAVETDLASNDLGLEAQRLSTQVEQLETQLTELCDRLRDSFLPVSDVCPAGEPATPLDEAG